MSEPTEIFEDRELETLLEEAGPRPGVPEDDLAAIKAAFRAEWEDLVRAPAPEQSRGIRPLPLAVATTTLIAVGIGWWWWQIGQPEGPDFVARVEALRGEVQIRLADGARLRPLAADGEIPPGAEVRSADDRDGRAGRTALRLMGGAVDGPSVRLDSGSRVRLVSASVLELERGAVYVDTGADSEDGSEAGGSIEIRTPLGVATDLGTRFEVRLLDDTQGAEALRLRVREGKVRLAKNGLAESAGVGEELTLHADGRVERAPIALHGQTWNWVVQAAPAFDIEGKTLREFLDWVARETGWQVRYSDPPLAEAAGTIVLHGSMGGVTADQAPGVVLPGAGLEYEVADGRLTISR